MHHSLAWLAQQISDKITEISPAHDVIQEMADMIFTQDEQSGIFEQWEDEQAKESELKSKENIKNALTALGALSCHEKKFIIEKIEDEDSRYSDHQKFIRALALNLDLQSSKKVLDLMQALIES